MKPYKATTPQKAKRRSIGVIVRFVIIGLLWLAVCGWYLARLIASNQSVTLIALFPLIASAIVVFVPLYKKYIRNESK